MKKTIFLVLLGLLCSVGSVWGGNIDLFSASGKAKYTVPANTNEVAISSSYATISGAGTMYVTNLQTKDSKNLVSEQGPDKKKKYAFTFTNDNTFFTVKLDFAIAVGDVISLKLYTNNTATDRGVMVSTEAWNGSKPATAGKYVSIVGAAKSDWVTLNHTVTAGSCLIGKTTLYLYRATGNGYQFTDFTVTRSLSAPLITTQPSSSIYAIDDTPSDLTVAAIASTGSLNYHWYKGATSTPAPATDEEIDEATTATLAAAKISTAVAGTSYYYCVVGDEGANTTTSSVATIVVSTPTLPTITIDADINPVVKGNTATLSATIDGVPAPTIQWYKGATSTPVPATDEAIDGATNTTYQPSTATISTSYYYAIATNEAGNTTSNVITLTVKGSPACELTNIKFSNGAYGAISTLNGDNEGTITVPYLSGESAPSINESSIEISANATKSIAGNIITVTAEDGETTGTYTITKTAYSPLSVSGGIAETAFENVPSWVFNPYGYEGGKGVKFAKAVNNDGTARISLGNTRQYYFVEAGQVLALTSGTTSRAINVYRNGVKLDAPTASGASGVTINIALDPDAVKLRQFQDEHMQQNKLGCVRFCAGDSDFRSGCGIEHRIGLPCDG